MMREHGRRPLIPSSLARVPGPSWSFWLQKSVGLLRLAASKARSAPEIMQASVAHAWRHRWRRMLACTSAKAFASSLVEHRSPVSAAGDIPSVHDEIRSDFHVR